MAKKSIKERLRQWYVRKFVGPSPEVRRRGFAAYASGRVNAPLEKNPDGDGYIIKCERINHDDEGDDEDKKEREEDGNGLE